MVHEEYAPRSLAFGVSQRADVNALGPAVVGSRVTCAVGKLHSLDGPDQLRMGWIGLSIQDVETGRSDAWDDKITTLDMRMRGVGAKA